MDRSAKQKLNGEIRELTNMRTQMDITDFYRTFQLNTKVYTFFSAPDGTSSKTDHVLGHKANLNRFKSMEEKSGNSRN